MMSYNSLIGCHRISTVLPVRPSLLAAISATEPPTVRAPIKLGIKHNSRHSDNLVLEIRRLREQCRLPIKQITETVTQLGYSISENQIRNYLNYTTRGYLVPAEGAKSYLTTESK
jgi:hypothetical protein